MKKEFVFISGVLLANICAFADRWAFSEFTKLFPYSEIEYKVIEDADVYNQRTEPIDKVRKGETFTTDRIALVYFDKKDNNRPRNGAIVYGCKIWMDSVKGCRGQKMITVGYQCGGTMWWFPKSQGNLWKPIQNGFKVVLLNWYEDGLGTPSKILIRNTMLSFEINNVSHLIKIRSIKKENDAYIITGVPGNYFTNETLEGEMFHNFPKADTEGCVILKLEKNGKRLFLYDGMKVAGVGKPDYFKTAYHLHVSVVVLDGDEVFENIEREPPPIIKDSNYCFPIWSHKDKMRDPFNHKTTWKGRW